MPTAKFNRILNHPFDVPEAINASLKSVIAMLNRIRAASEVAGPFTSIWPPNASMEQDDGRMPYASASANINSHGTQTESYLELSSGDAENTVAILGDRGTGKSTLLEYLCAQLLHNGDDIVLPILRPELFAARDTLAGWVLAALNERFESRHMHASNTRIQRGTRAVELSDLITTVRGHESLLQRGYGEALHTQGMSAAEFVRDATKLNSAGAAFTSNWCALAEACLYATMDTWPINKRPLLIIPIDDADQRPELISSLFSEIRMLTWHPSVVVMMCANQSLLRDGLLSQYLGGNGHDHRLYDLLDRAFIDRSYVESLVGQQLTKSLPWDLRASLTNLDQAGRLDFVPIGEDLSLLDVLRGFPVTGMPHLETLADLFSFGDRLPYMDGMWKGDATAFAECFSDVARELSQLHGSLRLSRTLGASGAEPAARAVQIIVNHALRVAKRDNVRVPDGAVVWRQGTDGLRVEFDYRRLTSGKTSGTGFVVRRKNLGNLSVTVGVRRVSSFYSRIRDDSGSEPEPDTPEYDAAILPAAFTNSMYLARELVGPTRAVQRHVIHGSLSTPGGTSWAATFSSTASGQPVSANICTIPNWDDFYDYFLFSTSWNRVVDYVEPTISQVPSTDTLHDWFLLLHLALIEGIQRMRSGNTPLIRQLLRRIRGIRWDTDAGDSTFERELADISKRYSRLFASAARDSAPARDRDFAYWLQVDIVNMAHELSCSKQMVQSLLEVRRQAVEPFGTLKAANALASRSLVREIRENIAADWVTPLVATLELLGDPTAASIPGEQAAAKRRADEEFNRILEQLGNAGVPTDLLLRLRFFGVTRRMAETLLTLGLPSEFVDNMMRQYGATAEGEKADRGVVPGGHITLGDATSGSARPISGVGHEQAQDSEGQ